MRKTIILDTNFLLIPGQFKVDVFSEIDRICDFEHELATVPETLEELRKIADSGNGKDARAAKMGLELLRKRKVAELKNYRKVFKSADDAIVAIADNNVIVATQDKLLRTKLNKRGIRIVTLRQKQYLKFLGD